MSDVVKLKAAAIEDSDTVYRMICELKQAQADRPGFNACFTENLRDPNIFYQLAWLGNKAVGMISLHLQYHLHHARRIGEIQELVVLEEARGHGVGKQLLAWAEAKARKADAELTELSTSTSRKDAHRFYEREGYRATHIRFTKPVETPDDADANA
ncbi:aminoalkylphosphonate N-acetyltransferase [Enterobacter sp. Ap-916]|uniref:aminoalkylphosphonate N-acetyltransferase n=1 Tax=Enterobacteriaceae TaxID=543 RepID=UPI00141ECD86|nr:MULTISPECIES: aminoalkylphosphonate N-acetyltransferase [unclassified Enterobacter]NIF58281.1 aminoalkylphosphonate N-acetyltransferase [Enterobacter sp. Ap-867]NIG30559.1 aminoalkylphosphonate N-acetyltransferase [Enterobacter sp. Ap-916]